MEPRLIYDNSACRKGKGTHFAMGRLEGFLREYYRKNGTDGYFLKCDIRKYFDSIDHEVLKRKLEKIIQDERVFRLLIQMIDSYETEKGKGLPMGNQTSQWFAVWYLDSLDRLVKEKYRVKYYTRYMDDFILLHRDKEYLKEVKNAMEEHLEELSLSFNEKTQLIPIKNGVDYLGFRFYLTKSGKVVKRLRTDSKKRLKRKLKKMQSRYECGEMELEDISRRVASFKGHLKHGDTWYLQRKLWHDFVLTRNSVEKQEDGSEDDN